MQNKIKSVCQLVSYTNNMKTCQDVSSSYTNEIVTTLCAGCKENLETNIALT